MQPLAAGMSRTRRDTVGREELLYCFSTMPSRMSLREGAPTAIRLPANVGSRGSGAVP